MIPSSHVRHSNDTLRNQEKLQEIYYVVPENDHVLGDVERARVETEKAKTDCYATPISDSNLTEFGMSAAAPQGHREESPPLSHEETVPIGECDHQSREVHAAADGRDDHLNRSSNHLSAAIRDLRESTTNDVVKAPYAEESKNKDESEVVDDDEIASWRPVWLRPLVLASFSALFMLFSTFLLLIYLKAQRGNGLFEIWQDFRLAWRFGPTAGRGASIVYSDRIVVANAV
ncbi:hypothetical protein CSAL01_07577 [Colletotrichum salicis]|uniref:Uncharacterized protein n=1 Tax=Colletotrichum salicis TaxID=1209931 RepID=A0A135S4V3_9PEZI|nr:hypothetical protein CSAL01_07577 [Colletotrichum salicis]